MNNYYHYEHLRYINLININKKRLLKWNIV